MDKCVLLIDVGFLANRAMYSTGKMVHPQDPRVYVGTLHGMLNTCIKLERMFQTLELAFFFDSKDLSKRRAILPTYKQGRLKARQNEDEEMQEVRKSSYKQVINFYNLLKQAGCKNVYGVPGYEADDLIASAVWNQWDTASSTTRLVIISSDSDLYQLLQNGKVCMYNPATDRYYTESRFHDDYGIPTRDWPLVKAIAGCPADSIKGVKGVGITSALRYMRDELEVNSKIRNKIEDAHELVDEMMELVELPFKGCPDIILETQHRGIDWSLISKHIGSTTWDVSEIVNHN